MNTTVKFIVYLKICQLKVTINNTFCMLKNFFTPCIRAVSTESFHERTIWLIWQVVFPDFKVCGIMSFLGL